MFNGGSSMADNPRPNQDERSPTKRQAHHERFELLEHLHSLLEPAMSFLGIVFLGLLLLDYSSVEIAFFGPDRIDQALKLIWIVFLADFALRLVVAPAKVAFLRHNWLAALSLALPFLRPLRAFRAVRAVRSLSLVRFLGGINRGMRVLRLATRGRQFAYVGILTIVIALAGAVGALYFDQGIAGAPIQTFSDAIWWSSALVTTMNSEKYVVSPEARTIGILMRIYALSVFGFITASIASYLIGAADTEATSDDVASLQDEIAALRREIALTRQGLGQSEEADAPTTPVDSLP
jgi:voltage-gated potassium channel